MTTDIREENGWFAVYVDGRRMGDCIRLDHAESLARDFEQAAEFKLSNPPAKPKPRDFGDDHHRQRVIFSGLDCLPDQLDLFETDGEA